MENRPNRPFENFEHYLQTWGGTEYTCFECYGRGKVVAEGEFCDPVEGYKHAKRETCPICRGTKKVSRVDHVKRYQARMKVYRDSLALWKQRQALRKSALAKLTQEEKVALGVD